MVRVTAVTALDRFRLRVSFTDGTEREVDVEKYLRGPVFEPLKSQRS